MEGLSGEFKLVDRVRFLFFLTRYRDHFIFFHGFFFKFKFFFF